MALSYAERAAGRAELGGRSDRTLPSCDRAVLDPDRDDSAVFCIPTITSSCRPSCASHL